jgi:hypothetical protein
VLKLFHKDTLIANIEDPSQDGLWLVGKHKLLPSADRFKEFFEYAMNEENWHDQDDPYGAEYWEHWTVENEDGLKQNIGCPAIHNDGDIYWRYL